MLKIKYGMSCESMIFWNKLFSWQLTQKMAKYAIAPYHIDKQFKYAVVRGDKLIFYFLHSSAKQEFAFQFENIKQHLRESFKEHRQQCKEAGITFRDITALVHLQQENSLKKPQRVAQIYKERSTGDFTYNRDSIFAKQFENLAQAIKRRIAQEKSQNFKEA
ncbi:hypothetical protein [uncultured Helicobacter sp.]|mgnify:FL=1|uniref:hypothetical protein n=1 Tax=uncultured Helicobacter sp. TaxID=175537 RepID=UPI00262CD2C8|nr:hypothetical protein [uncultured Helicobacter sp.]